VGCADPNNSIDRDFAFTADEKPLRHAKMHETQLTTSEPMTGHAAPVKTL